MANHLYSLMEAYNSVYDSQELTEDQIWEEVESWVNSLMEEGYDLSEYSWEDMYEEYLNEVKYDVEAEKRGRERAGAALSWIGNTARGVANAAVDSFKTDKNPTKGKETFSSSPSAPKPSKGGSADPYGASGAAGSGKVGPKIVGPKIVGPKIVGPGTPAATPARAPAPAPAATRAPAATPARAPAPAATRAPAATPARTSGKAPAPSSAKVAPTKPATGMLGKTSFERRTPTSTELKAAQAARASGASPEKALQAAKSSSAPKPVTPSAAINAAPKISPTASGSVVPATNAIAAKPSSAMSQDSIRRGRLNMGMEYDAYDLVLEYLLSEGHAETVEEAQYIMIEMDAEMVSDIVEAESSYDKNRKRAAQRAAARNEARAKGQTGNVPGVGYVTSRKEKETYTDSSGKTRHGKGL
jgi:hypothetical protein